MWHASASDAVMIRQAIEAGDGQTSLESVLAIMDQTQSLAYTKQKALEERDKAIAYLEVLPDSEHKQALVGLAHLAVERIA
jgi:octaprenyl-diphosphate synthase